MNGKRFFLMLSGLCLMPIMGMAMERSTVNETSAASELHRRCRHIVDSWRCNSEPGCQWNRWEDYCEEDHGGGGGGDHGQACRYIEYRDRCHARHDCYWDRHRGCVSYGEDDDRDRPRRCHHYNSPYECNEAGCHWSHHSQSCESRH